MKNFIVYSICAVVVIVSLYFVYYYSDSRVIVSFDSCVDGDTIWLNINNKREKVRLLGIDAPEIEKEGVIGEEYGEESKIYLCDKLSNSNNISIEYDDSTKRRDKYGRVLVWLFIDNKNMNVDLVSHGFAMVRYVYDDYKYVKDLCLGQNDAYKSHLGIWNNNNDYDNNYCIKKKII